jgi:hypothetical protein
MMMYLDQAQDCESSKGSVRKEGDSPDFRGASGVDFARVEETKYTKRDGKLKLARLADQSCGAYSCFANLTSPSSEAQEYQLSPPRTSQPFGKAFKMSGRPAK